MSSSTRRASKTASVMRAEISCCTRGFSASGATIATYASVSMRFEWVHLATADSGAMRAATSMRAIAPAHRPRPRVRDVGPSASGVLRPESLQLGSLVGREGLGVLGAGGVAHDGPLPWRPAPHPVGPWWETTPPNLGMRAARIVTPDG